MILLTKKLLKKIVLLYVNKDVFICVNKLLNARIRRGESRATVTPKTERFVIIANGFQLRIGD